MKKTKLLDIYQIKLGIVFCNNKKKVEMLLQIYKLKDIS